jgi:NADH-quinone oxidoreductase subunit J
VTGEAVGFYCLSTVLIGSALAVVLTKNLFHAVLWLALALTGTAGVFLLLDAEFLAAVQLLLYAGGAAVSIVLVSLIVSAVMQRPLATVRAPMAEDLTRQIGETVLTRFVLPFELLAVLMLAGLMGAIYFARPDD